jgi:hypothetical protein
MNTRILKGAAFIMLVSSILCASLLAATVLSNVWGIPTAYLSSPLDPQGEFARIARLEGRTYIITIITNDTRFVGELTLIRATSTETDNPTFRADVYGSGLFEISLAERGFYKITLKSKHDKNVMQSTNLIDAKGFDLNAITSLGATSATLLFLSIALNIYQRKKHHGKHTSN